MALKETSIEDFSGGWNTSDSDLNLSSKYQPISENVVRGLDGSISIRQGCGLFADFRKGATETRNSVSMDFASTVGSPVFTFTYVAHGFSSGQHITFTAFAALTTGGLPPETFIGNTFGIRVIDADTFVIVTDVAATITSSGTRATSFVLDSYTIGGNIIHTTYFNRMIVAFTDMGEIGIADSAGNVSRIWGINEAEALSSGLVPTRQCTHWSSDNFKSTIIACNGYNRDKPLQINDEFEVEFLVDKSTLSNAFVPKADYVICLQGYVVFARTEYGDAFIEISAKGTDGTFTRDPNPADSVEIDVSTMTSVIEPVILGVGFLRDKLYIAFYDKGVMGTLGIYDADGNHTPDLSDTIAEHGSYAHRTIASLGNDVLMADYNGVPSLTLSRASGSIVPVRLSSLIEPTMQQHMKSLGEDFVRKKAFAVYDRNERTYMLVLPIYEPISHDLVINPLRFTPELRALGYARLYEPNHNLFENSTITFANMPDVGTIPAVDMNKPKRVVSVLNKDNVIVDLGADPGPITLGGGSNTDMVLVNNETLVYSFEYNNEFKIRRWTFARGWDFDCGCVSQRGAVFMAKIGKVYQIGGPQFDYYADFVGDYDRYVWENSTEYTIGTRVLDASQTPPRVYTAQVTHTSAASGTFPEDRAANPTYWLLYEGVPIDWVIETPWSDMRLRGTNKHIAYINLDTEGEGQFTVSGFVNDIYRTGDANMLAPQRQLTFSAGDTYSLEVNAGSSRNTRLQKPWAFGIRGKLIKWRYEGSNTTPIKIISHTMFYKAGNLRG